MTLFSSLATPNIKANRVKPAAGSADGEGVQGQVEGLSVSVAMATFNGAAYLDQQLADLAAQTRLPAELVVCDDGSTDATLEILERFAAAAPFAVRIHRNEVRLGYRANFMKCAGLCRSDLIAFCDQDDRWLPGKLGQMVQCFADPEVLLAFHAATIVAADERPLGARSSLPRPVGATSPLGGSPWTFALGFTQVFRRWLCDCDRWWPLSHDHNTASDPLAHDQWYFFLAAALGTIVNLADPLVKYRQHDANVFGWVKAEPMRSRVLERARQANLSCDRRSDDAARRAQILDRAAEALAAPFDQRARAGATAYRRLAARCAQRAAVYAGTSAARRAGAFARLSASRGYGADPWRFGAKAAAMDLIVGVPGLDRRPRAG